MCVKYWFNVWLSKGGWEASDPDARQDWEVQLSLGVQVLHNLLIPHRIYI